jgi:filamentous hemagglutinin family protein
MKNIFIQPNKIISNVTKIRQYFSLELLVRSLVITLGIFSGLTIPASADITSSGDGTIVTPPTGNGNTIDITVGTLSGDGKNLFHSFGTFNLTNTQTANFKTVSNVPPLANVQNIFGRVNGGSPSSIDGKLQVNGGINNPPAVNLFLMNPAGIVFGKNASLDINGAFTATTAKAIGFGNGNWFNAVGVNTYGNLNDNPTSLAFPGVIQGSIFSAATLSNVQPGKSITLVGGTVISTGDIKTAGGNISIATVKGGQYVQIKVDGSLLGLELPTALTTPNSIDPKATNFTTSKLAALLTGETTKKLATGVTVDSNNVVKLVGNTRSILSGDIITKNLNTSGDPNGGKVSLNTQAGDIIVNSIDTRSQEFEKGGNGGDVNVNAGGIFRVTGFTDLGNFKVKDAMNNLVNDKSGLSIFTGGNLSIDEQQKEGFKDLRGGKINITYQGKEFVTGGKIDTSLAPNVVVPLILDLGFTFPEGASGSKGAVISRNSNSIENVVFRNGTFFDQSGKEAGGFGIKGGPVIPRGDDGQTSNPDQQASRPKSNPDEQASKPKSKENCIPSSTSVASNPTAAPTRSAGNPNTVSADPCQQNTSNNGILQILTDRE